jgi:hypothetical protein
MGSAEAAVPQEQAKERDGVAVSVLRVHRPLDAQMVNEPEPEPEEGEEEHRGAGVSVFRCFGVSVFRCFGVSVLRCFGASVLRSGEGVG